MDSTFSKLLLELESDIRSANLERDDDGLPPLPRLGIRVLGQMALRVHPKTSDKLHLAQTTDLDATLKGDWTTRLLLKQRLSQMGLIYDELSTEIWIPPESTFTNIHDSHLLTVEVLDPIFVLVAKAIKAPEKNRILIQEAIADMGEVLVELIEKYGGNVDLFLKEL